MGIYAVRKGVEVGTRVFLTPVAGLLFRVRGRHRVGALFAALAVFALMSGAWAVSYNGEVVYTYYQPDGSSFPVKLYGDEFFAYQRTLDGHEVVKDPTSGYWCFARLDGSGQSFESLGIPVVTATAGSEASARAADEAGGAAPPYQKLPDDVVLARVREAQMKHQVDEKGRPLSPSALYSAASAASGPYAAPPPTTTVGDYVGLCVLVDFPDQPGTISQTQVEDYCNQPSGYIDFGNACSVNEYYKIQSNNKLNYTNVVTAYVRMPKPKTYYDNNQPQNWGTATNQELVTTALDSLMAQGFDFTPLSRDGSGYIDAISVFYAGTCTSGWTLGLWAMSWSIPDKTVAPGIIASRFMLTDIGTSLLIGTFCHENGHMLCGFPDLYSYIGDNASIVGYYSLMCGGNYGGGGKHPTNIDPYLKYKAGWADVVEVNASTHVRATAQTDLNHYFKFTNPAQSQEYFIIENRNGSGYEGPYGGDQFSVAPGQGLVVWQVYEGGDNTNCSIQQNGTYTMPYEAFIVEATPTTAPVPWYSDPEPLPDSFDTFYAGQGADPLNDTSFPGLHFWDLSSFAGRTVNSGMTIHSYGPRGASLSYTIGAGDPPTFVTISGKVSLNGSGLAGVVMNGLTGNPSTDASGAYTASVASGWNGTVTPALAGYTFTPASEVYTNVTTNQTQNYTATVVLSAPKIAQQPVSLTVNVGQTASFSVAATGTAPLSYQWSKGTTAIFGATKTTFAIASAQTSDGGSFTCKVSNSLGNATSNAALLTVNLGTPPAITQQPASLTVNVGQSASFTVAASGTAPLSYQWRKGGITISGATQTTLALTSAQTSDGGSYTCKVSNAAGNVISNAATLTVNGPAIAPVITQQPASMTVNSGQTASFNVTVSGSVPLTYQWRKDGTAIAGATRAALTVAWAQASDAGNYKCQVANSAGNATSNAATLTVNVPAQAPVITQQPVSLTVNVGQSASFTVAATGTAPLSYQWSKDGAAISGATQTTLAIASVQASDAGNYTCAVSSPTGSTTSNPATLTVSGLTTAPSITRQPVSLTVNEGQSASFTLAATGTAPLSYQWNKGSTSISGATQATLTIPSAQTTDAGIYTCMVSNSIGSVTSNQVTLTVSGPATAPAIIQQPTSQTVNVGQSASFTVAATGTGPLAYQWSKAGAPITGATQATYTIASAQMSDTGGYTCKVTNSAGSATSNAATLTVTPPTAPSITQQPASLTVNVGQGASFTVEATGTAPLSYQWSKGGTAIAGATQTTLAIASPQTSDADSYTCTVTNSAGSVISAPAMLTVNVPATVPAITQQPVSLTVNAGQTASFSVAATGTAPLSYQWSNGGTVISGATQTTLSIASAQVSDAGSYTCKVANSAGSVTSISAALTVNAPATAPSITQQPVSLTVNAGQTVSFSLAASGTSLSYQWSKGGTAISGATLSTLSIASAQASDAGSYTCKVTNSAGSVTSDPAILTVTGPAPVVTQQPASLTVNVGQSASFTVKASGTGPLSYQWSKGGAAIAGATQATLAIAAAQPSDAGNYTCMVANSSGSVTSDAATLTVSGQAVAPSITQQPVSLTVNAGLMAAFTVAASGTAPLSYQWNKGASAIAGATQATLTIALAQASDAGSYTCTVANSAGSVTSNVVALTVATVPSLPQLVSPPNGGNLSGTVVPCTWSAVPGATQYRCQISSDAAFSNPSTSSVVSDTYVNWTNMPNNGDTVYWRAAAGNSAGWSDYSAPWSFVNGVRPPVITQQPVSLTVNVGQSASFTLAATGVAPLGFQWSKDGTAISGATQATCTIPSAKSADAGSYTCAVTNLGGSVTSAVAALTVMTIPSSPQLLSPSNGGSVPGSILPCKWTAVSGATQYRCQISWDAAFNSPSTSSALTDTATNWSNMPNNDTTVYWRVAAGNSAGWSDYSAPWSVRNGASVTPPVITQQPASLTVDAGQSANFTIAVAGTAPLSYQWSKDGTPISGATLATYTIASPQPADAGTYYCTVPNAAGSVTSSVATLTVQSAPAGCFGGTLAKDIPSAPTSPLNGDMILLTLTAGLLLVPAMRIRVNKSIRGII